MAEIRIDDLLGTLQTLGPGTRPEDHVNKARKLDELGILYQNRFGLFGTMEDIQTAIVVLSHAVSLTPDGHADKPGRLTNLGIWYQRRFECLGELADIDWAIGCKSAAVCLTPDGHADMPAWLNNLGNSYERRFERLGELPDINSAILCKSEATSLTPEGHAGRPKWLNNLGSSYQRRFERLGELADINGAIACISEAVSLTLDGHPDNPGWLSNLGNSYECRFEHLGELADLDRAITCKSEAVSLTPEGHSNKPTVLSNLGNSYERRFERFGELTDIDQAITCQSEAVSLTPDGHADKPGWLTNLGNSYECRFERLGELSDIDGAITYHTEAVSLTPDDHTNKPTLHNNLGSSYRRRFERFGELADINRAITCQSEAVSLAPDGHADVPALLNNLGSSYQRRFQCLGELADINKAITCQTEAASSTPNGHADKPGWLTSLGISYMSRFKCLEQLEDIDRAIAFQTEAVSLTPDGHASKPRWLNNLGISYQCRFERLGEHADIEQAIIFLQMAAQSSVGSSSIRFRASRRWAASAFISNHSTTLQAFHQVMALVPRVIWIGSTINSRFDQIHSIGTVAVEAAASAISAKQYELALEWLEAGRSVVWSQTLQLRTQFDKLSLVAPELAKRLQEVAQELETTTQRDTTAPSSHPKDLEAVAQGHRRLAEDYEKRLSDVRQMPGFQDFMGAKKVKDLMPAAQSGPVVVVNVHSSRCDALILLPNRDDLTHVPLPDLSSDDVAKLQSQILGLLGSSRARDRRPEFWDQPSDQFEDVLAALWHKIVYPVLTNLGYIQNPSIEPLPHITWCTTGALSFLPIHAAGCYDEAGPKIFDLVVSSYTPTLGTLISARSRSLDVGKILAVSQEDSLPKTKDELSHIRRHAKRFQYMQLEKNQATPQAVLGAMAECDCVHIASHGVQKIHKPTGSYFALHQGNLTLAEITKKSLNNKGLAFLSACQTATGDAKMPDEAVHLAAGMLIAGYPTVIATMWSIEDTDAPLVADKVYGELLKDGKLDGGRVARALHVAVANLRNEIGEANFYRWAAYIHLGV